MKEFFDGDILEGQYFNASKNGSKFFVDEDGKRFYISRKESSNALHKDRVKVELIRLQNKTSLNAVVISVLERTAETLVGTLDKTDKTCFFIPDLGGVDFHIRREYVGEAKNGDRIKVELLKWPKNKRRPEGKIVHVFGKTGEHEAEIQSIISKFDVQEDFPEKVLREANAIPLELDSEEIKKRSDLRKKFTFTIDGEDAKDFDDSISFEPTKGSDGWYNLGVHIADVSYYVQPNSELDKEAYQRATSIYLVDRVVPMLPRGLSNGVCSLRPDEDKLTFSFMCQISEDGQIRNEKFQRTATRSDVRLNYDQAQDIIDEGKSEGVSGNILQVVSTCDKIAKKLRRERMKEKALEFHSKQPKFILDKEGEVLGIEYDEAFDAHQLIEEFMLLANRKVSKFLSDRPSIYRSHDEPTQERLSEVKVFLDRIGYDLDVSGGEATKDSINKITEDLKDQPEEDMVKTLLIRTMSKAYYTPYNIGHYGLSFEFYTHYTSPIRRYIDLQIHRLLSDKLGNNGYQIKVNDIISVKNKTHEASLDKISKHCSEKEKQAASAQRESIAYKQAEWMSEKVGEKFQGVISDVKKWGVYVELTESGCRGLISKDELESAGYSLDKDNFKITTNSGNIYKLGDVIGVECISVDLQMRLIEFKL